MQHDFLASTPHFFMLSQYTELKYVLCKTNPLITFRKTQLKISRQIKRIRMRVLTITHVHIDIFQANQNIIA